MRSSSRLVEQPELVGVCGGRGSWPPRFLLGSEDLDELLAIDRRAIQPLLERLADSGRVVGYDVRFRHKSGKLIDCQVAAEIVELEGEPNLLFLVRDVSHLARARAQQREIAVQFIWSGE